MLSNAPTILFIDAASRYGWACGPAGQIPESSSGSFGKNEESSQAARFAGAMSFVLDMIDKHGIGLKIVVEEPVPTNFPGAKGQTNANTTQMLFGLPACVQGMAYHAGVYAVRYARVANIRHHFIGGNPKGEIAKPLVMQKCLELGWIKPGDPRADFDRSDALAGWSFAEHMLAPELAQPVGQRLVEPAKRKPRKKAA